MFETVIEEFEGDAVSRFLYTDRPEASLVDALREAGTRFDVSVGCYPDRDAGHNRLKVTGDDGDEVDAAADWLVEAVGAATDPGGVGDVRARDGEWVHFCISAPCVLV